MLVVKKRTITEDITVVVLLKKKDILKSATTYIKKETKNDMRMLCLNEKKKVPFSKVLSMWILMHENMKWKK